MTGSVFGSPLFMAPEQVEGKNPSGAIDLFALAGVMYRCISGRHPFEAEHAHAVMWRIVQEDAPRVSTSVPGVSEELDALIASMHARDPSARPRATEVSRRLRQFLSQAGMHDLLEATVGILPDRVLEAPVDLVSSPPKRPLPVAPRPRSRFLAHHKKAVVLALAGTSLVLALLLAGEIWDRMRTDPIPEASKVEVQEGDIALRTTGSDRPSERSVDPKRPSDPGSGEALRPKKIAELAHPVVEPPALAREPVHAPSPVAVTQGAGGARIEVRVGDEAPDDNHSIKPRIAFVNRSNSRIEWIQARWRLSDLPSGRVMTEAYYAPQCEVRLDQSGSTGDLVVTCSGLSLKPGQTWPGPDGLSLAVHTDDWRAWRSKPSLGLDRQLRVRSDFSIETK